MIISSTGFLCYFYLLIFFDNIGNQFSAKFNYCIEFASGQEVQYFSHSVFDRLLEFTNYAVFINFIHAGRKQFNWRPEKKPKWRLIALCASRVARSLLTTCAIWVLWRCAALRSVLHYFVHNVVYLYYSQAICRSGVFELVLIASCRSCFSSSGRQCACCTGARWPAASAQYTRSRRCRPTRVRTARTPRRTACSLSSARTRVSRISSACTCARRPARMLTFTLADRHGSR